MKKLLILFGVFLLTACAPPPPFGAYHITRPPLYDSLWKDVEKCSGITGDVSRINFNIVPPNDPKGFPYDGKQADGLWISYHMIYIAEWYKNDSFVVRHEMLHDLLQHGGHPDEYFCKKCYGTVATDCIDGHYVANFVYNNSKKGL